jgi:hypothetical protein
MSKKNTILLILILLVSSCAALSVDRPPANLLTRPNLESAAINDSGGLCFDKQDTKELLLYIDALEDYIEAQ